MIEIIVIIALIVLFIHICTREGMIFSFVSKRLSNIPDYVKKPLYDCPICMVPWWGSVILLVGRFTHLWDVTNVAEWIFILFAAAGLNTVLIYIVEQGKALSKALNESDCNCTKKLTEEEKSQKRKERIANFKGIEPISYID